jgi:hypothetical protein
VIEPEMVLVKEEEMVAVKAEPASPSASPVGAVDVKVERDSGRRGDEERRSVKREGRKAGRVGGSAILNDATNVA